MHERWGGRRRCWVLVAAVLTAMLAVAAPGLAQPPSFYDPPSPLPEGRDGDVIRSEPAAFVLGPGQVLRVPVDTTRVMYRSTDTAGEPIAVTGTVLVPRWPRPGVRRLVGFAVGTQARSVS